MKIRIGLGFLFLSLFLIGCGKKEIVGTGHLAAQARNVSVFSTVDVSGYYNVNITIGQPQSVIVKVNGNLLPYIVTAVNGKKLTIKSKKGYLLRPQGIPEVDIVMPSLSALNLSGNNHVTLNNYRGNSLDLNFAGANQFEGTGIVTTLSIEASGSTGIDTQKLIAKKVTIDSNGYSKIVVNAQDTLKVSIAGNSEINFLGNPSISQSIMGSGTIARLPVTVNK